MDVVEYKMVLEGNKEVTGKLTWQWKTWQKNMKSYWKSGDTWWYDTDKRKVDQILNDESTYKKMTKKAALAKGKRIYLEAGSKDNFGSSP